MADPKFPRQKSPIPGFGAKVYIWQDFCRNPPPPPPLIRQCTCHQDQVKYHCHNKSHVSMLPVFYFLPPLPIPTTNPNFPFQPSANKSQRQHHWLEKKGTTAQNVLTCYCTCSTHAQISLTR